ncbi:MAG: Uma2 family endonuclease [Acidobacteria bacterium]|nr:Uma2 family endonuclease [Acidobacteriota bacterium]
MGGPVKKNATYADLVELPDNVVGEIVGGTLFVTPRPRVGHALAQVQLLRELDPRFHWGEGGPGGWMLLGEPELHLGAEIVVPDVAGWRAERWAPLPADAPFVGLAPDWVCEITSPGTARLDRVHKLPVYLGAGVGFAWIIDPVARTLEVLQATAEAGKSRWTLVAQHAADEHVHAVPFEAVELELGRWWM